MTMINDNFFLKNKTDEEKERLFPGITSGKRPLVVIAGPTAIGKTAFSIRLAKEIGGEIISADSVQVYKGLDIGSAKITVNEKEGITHHLIDVLDPKEPFNVFLFSDMCKEALEKIYASSHIPIITGGTGFYIQAVLKNVQFEENEDNTEIREKLTEIALTKGTREIYDRLKEIDNEAAESIGIYNTKRLIRALEYYYETGEKISEHNEREKRRESPYAFRYFVFNTTREKLYERIEKRVDIMMEKGLLDEVKALKEYGCTASMTSMQGLGYKQLFKYLEGEYTYDEAIERIKIETRHFAKRQLTWFKREAYAEWIDIEKEDPFNVFTNGNIR